MAKGLRSKAKRRLRTIRKEHHWETRGKQDLQKIAAKLHDPYYDLKADRNLKQLTFVFLVGRKPNAFVEPDNPLAVFP